METRDIAIIFGIIAGIVGVGGFLGFVIYPLYHDVGDKNDYPTPMPTPTLTQTPPVTPSPSPTPTYVIDTMDSTFGWETGNDDKGSSINIKSIPGRTGNAIEISYDLKEWGWVEIFKEINPEILSGTKGINFFL